MMRVYRIAKSRYIHDLSGQGAKQFGGRWNAPGLAALYTSEARSLAILELMVHFNGSATLSESYSILTLEVPEKLILPVGSDVLDFLHETNSGVLASITKHYFEVDQVLGLRVPSALVPREFNVILNPESPDFSKFVKKVEFGSVFLDKRLMNWKVS
jgi:RES domain-containing protein